MADRTKAEGHFAFGKNWESYAKLVGNVELDAARNGLLKLLPAEQWQDRTFLDIGCGSGLHSLSAASLGVSRILATDIDLDSVETTGKMLTRTCLDIKWEVKPISVFDSNPEDLGTFDIVYSWGVLHHTGDMWRALDKAADLVSPGGALIVALYRSTTLDRFWTMEKRVYANASPALQAVIRSIYLIYFRAVYAAQGRSYRDYVSEYKTRGMDFYHDVHDWLGGYPYETALAGEVDDRLRGLGFASERVWAGPKTRGILSSGCDEYVYRRHPDAGTRGKRLECNHS
jgi:2-polyprenyl-6-hydroxyphenyl methylase/3-demethylubiquinone-9 3-methyltransferase